MPTHIAVLIFVSLSFENLAAYAQNTNSETTAPDLLKDLSARPAMQLSQFEQFALAANPTLQQVSALSRQSAAQARQVGLLPNPSIGYQGEQIRGGSFRGGEQGGFVQQTFVLGGKLSLRRNVFEQQQREYEIGATEQRYRVLTDVRRSFYSAFAAQEMVRVRRQLLDLALDAVETAHQLANVGQADAPDALQAEVEGEQATLDYTTAQRTFIQEFRALAAVAGQPNLPLSPLSGTLENPPQIDADRILNEIVENSPAVKRAQQDVNRAEAELKSAKRESVPDLQLRAGLQQNFESLNQYPGKAAGVQGFVTAGIALPIFNRNQGNVAAALADLEHARAEVNRLQLLLRQTSQSMLQGYLAAQLQANRYKNEIIPRATRAYQLYLSKYREMAAAYPQVLVSQRTLFQVQVAYIGILREVWSNAIALENYTLSEGLSPVTASVGNGATLNPPASASSITH